MIKGFRNSYRLSYRFRVPSSTPLFYKGLRKSFYIIQSSFWSFGSFWKESRDVSYRDLIIKWDDLISFFRTRDRHRRKREDTGSPSPWGPHGLGTPSLRCETTTLHSPWSVNLTPKTLGDGYQSRDDRDSGLVFGSRFQPPSFTTRNCPYVTAVVRVCVWEVT